MEEKNLIHDGPIEELRLGEIIKVIIEYFYEVLNNWKLILLLMLPFAGFLAFRAFSDIPKYYADSTFMLNDDEQADITGIGDLLGSLGISRGKKTKNSLAKVLQLFQSRRIVESTLFTKTLVGDKNDFYANHILRIYGLKEIIEEAGRNKGLLKKDSFYFSHGVMDSFNLTEKTVMSILYDKVAGNEKRGLVPMIASNLDDKSGIMKISATTSSEELTITMLGTFYNQLSQYYVDKTIEKQKKIHDILNGKKDSIERALNLADFRLADFEDSHRKLVTVKGELERTKLRRQRMILEAMYIEVVKNLEKADFALRRKTPYVQMIDPPQSPIFPSKESWIFGLILGGIVGAGLGIVFIILRKIIRDALNRENRS